MFADKEHVLMLVDRKLYLLHLDKMEIKQTFVGIIARLCVTCIWTPKKRMWFPIIFPFNSPSIM